MPIPIRFKRLHPKAKLPGYATPGAACFDFQAAFDAESLTLEPGKVVAIPTGLACEVPRGFELQIRARSGLALKQGLTLANGIGTVDSDYRGEIKILAVVLGREPLVIRPGDRVAQGFVGPVPEIEIIESVELTETERGTGGFGSTGVAELPTNPTKEPV